MYKTLIGFLLVTVGIAGDKYSDSEFMEELNIRAESTISVVQMGINFENKDYKELCPQIGKNNIMGIRDKFTHAQDAVALELIVDKCFNHFNKQ